MAPELIQGHEYDSKVIIVLFFRREIKLITFLFQKLGRHLVFRYYGNGNG